VIHWTRKRLLLPPVPLRLLFARQPAKPGQVLPAVRTSISATSSLSSSMQDKTVSCFWGTAHLLKTYKHYPTQKANKKQTLFPPLLRPIRYPSTHLCLLRRAPFPDDAAVRKSRYFFSSPYA
jgi:hypothetical protein